jgi:hypothetical protein
MNLVSCAVEWLSDPHEQRRSIFAAMVLKSRHLFSHDFARSVMRLFGKLTIGIFRNE